MGQEQRATAPDILPVGRTKAEARAFYDRVSGFYDHLTRAFERRFAEMALERLSIREGEAVLEVGFGTGHCITRIAAGVGLNGRAYGLDISIGMLAAARTKLVRSGLQDQACLGLGDAARLPFAEDVFDAVFMSYALELFETDEIPMVLEQIQRVLKPGRRLAVASLSKEDGMSLMLRLYEWAHRKWPKYADCRPIYVERALREAGYEIVTTERVRWFGLPNEIVVAAKPKPA
jgi:demethylmenaquinone methyltransferase/2-methoxy-6-polyprenyl-1,4-benzoquinol methylase